VFVNGNWTWRRSNNVPCVWVTDLEANFVTGEIWAGTYGRGMFVALASSDANGPPPTPPPLPLGQVAIGVRAVVVGEDGPTRSLTVPIDVSVPSGPTSGKAPFEVVVGQGSTVTLTAPASAQDGNEVLTFIGWLVGDQKSQDPSFTLTAGATTIALAYYDVTEVLPGPSGGRLQIALSLQSRKTCVSGHSHDLIASFGVSGGTAPVRAMIQLTKPNGDIETLAVRPRTLTKTFPLNFPEGGKASIRIKASDSRNASAVGTGSAGLQPCP